MEDEPEPEPTPTPTPEPTPTRAPESVPPTEAEQPTKPEQLTEPEQPSEPETLPAYAVTLVDGAPLYADRDAEPMAQLPAETVLAVEAIDGDWIAVRYDDAAAWIPAAEVRLTDALPEPGTAAIEYGDEAVDTPAAEPADDSENGLTLEGDATVPEEGPLSEEAFEPNADDPAAIPAA